MQIARPGKTLIHHAVLRKSCAVKRSWPQLIMLGSERPRKPRLDSMRMARLASSATCTMMGGSALGRISRRMMW
jgi:hypothetical protein